MPMSLDDLRKRIKNLPSSKFPEVLTASSELSELLKKIFRDHANLNAMQAMISMVIGNRNYTDKHDELLQLAEAFANFKDIPKDISKELVLKLKTLENKIESLESDVTSKAYFFTNLLKTIASPTGQNESNQQDLERFTKFMYDKFNKYKGSVQIDDTVLHVPVEFSKDKMLSELARKDSVLLQSSKIKRIKQKNSGNFSDHAQMVMDDIRDGVVAAKSTVAAAFKSSDKNKSEGANNAAIPAAVSEDVALAEQAMENNPATELASLKPSEERELKYFIEFFRDKPKNLEIFNNRIKQLTELKGVFDGLQATNKAKLVEFNIKDVKSTVEKCKDFFNPIANLAQQFVDTVTTDNEQVDLVVFYQEANKKFETENLELSHLINNLEHYKKAIKYIETSKLNRQDVKKVFAEIGLEKRIAIEHEMLIPYREIEAVSKTIIDGHYVSKNRPYGMKEHFAENRDDKAFAQTLNRSHFVKFCEASKALKNKAVSAGKTLGVGAVVLGATHGVTSLIMGRNASLVLSSTLAGASMAVASRFFRDSPDYANLGDAAKEDFARDLKESMGEIVKNAEFQKISTNILKLMHHRQCLLSNINGMRDDYLRKSGILNDVPAKTDAQIDLAIEEYFIASLTELFNNSFTLIFDMYDAEIKKDAQNSILSAPNKIFNKLFTKAETINKDRQRFIKHMLADFVFDTANLIQNSAIEKTFAGRHPQLASSMTGLFFGLVAAGIATAICLALVTPVGWLISAGIITFAIASVPSLFTTYKFREHFSFRRTIEDRKGLENASTIFKNQSTILLELADNVAKKTNQQEVIEAQQLADNDNGNVSLNTLKEVLGIPVKLYPLGAGWKREYLARHLDNKRVQGDLRPALEDMEKKSAEQTDGMRLALATFRLRNQNRKPILDYCEQAEAYLDDRKLASGKKDYDMAKRIKEQILQVVRVAGIKESAEGGEAFEIPSELRILYTESLDGSLADLRAVREMAEVENLLPLAASLELKMKSYKQTNLGFLVGSNLYRKKLGLGFIDNGFYGQTGDNTAEDKITENNIVSLLQSTFDFALYLDKNQDRPQFASEYTHSNESYLFLTLFIKQLAELTDPYKASFNPTVCGHVMQSIQSNWNMTRHDVEEMLLQVQFEEYATSTEDGYSIITLSDDPATDNGLAFKNLMQRHLPAYGRFENKIYRLDKKTETLKLVLNATNDNIGVAVELNAIFGANLVAPNLNKYEQNLSVHKLVKLEKITGQPHDTSVIDAMYVNLAFGRSKMTPEKLIRQEMASHEREMGVKFFIDAETRLDKKVFVFNTNSASHLDPTNGATDKYLKTTEEYIENTETLINAMITKMVSYKDQNAPAIYVSTAKLELDALIKQIQEKLVLMPAEIAEANAAATESSQKLAEAKARLDHFENNAENIGVFVEDLENDMYVIADEAQLANQNAAATSKSGRYLQMSLEALQLHRANLDLFSAIIKVAKVDEAKAEIVPSAPVAKAGFFGKKNEQATIIPKTTKEAVIEDLQKGVKSKEMSGKKVTLTNNAIHIVGSSITIRISAILKGSDKDFNKDLITFTVPASVPKAAVVAPQSVVEDAAPESVAVAAM